MSVVPLEMEMFQRERANGMYSTFAYYIAKIIVELPYNVRCVAFYVRALTLVCRILCSCTYVRVFMMSCIYAVVCRSYVRVHMSMYLMNVMLSLVGILHDDLHDHRLPDDWPRRRVWANR